MDYRKAPESPAERLVSVAAKALGKALEEILRALSKLAGLMQGNRTERIQRKYRRRTQAVKKTASVLLTSGPDVQREL